MSAVVYIIYFCHDSRRYVSVLHVLGRNTKMHVNCCWHVNWITKKSFWKTQNLFISVFINSKSLKIKTHRTIKKFLIKIVAAFLLKSRGRSFEKVFGLYRIHKVDVFSVYVFPRVMEHLSRVEHKVRFRVSLRFAFCKHAFLPF